MPKARTGVSQTPNTSQPQLEFPLVAETEQDDAGTDAQPDNWQDKGAADSDDAPTFAMVRESGIDGEKRCLYLVVESTLGEQFRLDFTPGCIPLTIAALSSELGYLRQHQPDQSAVVQPIVVDACQLGETANGNPALLASMEGGGELPLQMSLQDLQRLAREIDEYIRGRAWGRKSR